MEVHFLTGKGGVGKSAVAAAHALKLSQQGKKTLLVELGDESFYQDYLGMSEVDFKPKSYQGLFDVALWSGTSCLREYAIYLLKIESLYKLFFENPVSKTLIEVAPGLSELAILGKVTSGPPRNVGPKLPYEALVIDAFATGHFLALLRAPAGMAEVIRFGPMGEQSRSIVQVLKDPKICHYHIVCLPEELPVKESIELDTNLQQLVGAKAFLWLNKWVDFPRGLSKSGPNYEHDFIQTQARQEDALVELERVFSGRMQKLDFVFDPDEQVILQTLSKEMP